MTLISPEYRKQNFKLHEDPAYGVSGYKCVKEIWRLVELSNSTDVLDYGCGKRTLEDALRFPIKNYDPCIEGLDKTPEPADIVACTDVLEHIEPECLDAVLDDLQRVTKRYGFYMIANRPAKKSLPDGRNAHLIQEGPGWWLQKICARWRLVSFQEQVDDDKPIGFSIIVRPHWRPTAGR